MADIRFNVALGRVVEKILDAPANLEIILLKTAESDATLEDYDDVAALLAGANVEADFTNYVRKTGITGTVTVDKTNDQTWCGAPNQTWTSAGGALNNTLAKMIVCYRDGAGDANLMPIAAIDYVTTTDGTILAPEFDANGFYRVS